MGFFSFHHLTPFLLRRGLFVVQYKNARPCLLAVALMLAWVVPGTIHAGGVSFVDRSIWYNPDPFFAGQTVRVYAGILNTDSRDAYGSVELFAGEESLGLVEYSVRGGGNVATVWRDWRATAGDITFSAASKRIVLTQPGLPDEEVVLDSTAAKSSISLFVDTDTDGDRIGNRTDPDDDNDGIPDEEEITLGTNPLQSDTDGDGISDKEEKVQGTDPLRSDTDGDGVLDGEDDSPGNYVPPSESPFGDGSQSVAAAAESVRDTVVDAEKGIADVAQKLADLLRNFRERIDSGSPSGTETRGTGALSENATAGESPDSGSASESGAGSPDQLLDIGFDLDSSAPSTPAFSETLRKVFIGGLSAPIWILENRIPRLLFLVATLYIVWRLYRRSRS